MGAKLILLSAALVTLFATSAAAEVICLPATEMQRQLTQKWGERITNFGVVNDDLVAELWQSARGETWTFVIRSVDDRCAFFVGKAMRPVGPPKRKEFQDENMDTKPCEKYSRCSFRDVSGELR